MSGVQGRPLASLRVAGFRSASSDLPRQLHGVREARITCSLSSARDSFYPAIIICRLTSRIPMAADASQSWEQISIGLF